MLLKKQTLTVDFFTFKNFTKTKKAKKTLGFVFSHYRSDSTKTLVCKFNFKSNLNLV